MDNFYFTGFWCLKSEHIIGIHWGGFLLISTPAEPDCRKASFEREYIYRDFNCLIIAPQPHRRSIYGSISFCEIWNNNCRDF